MAWASDQRVSNRPSLQSRTRRRRASVTALRPPRVVAARTSGAKAYNRSHPASSDAARSTVSNRAATCGFAVVGTLFSVGTLAAATWAKVNGSAAPWNTLPWAAPTSGAWGGAWGGGGLGAGSCPAATRAR
ncbi:hypothetical protein DIPPA_15066 [Diplonema papillatum]|nr:hypothetical protein DIPPA_15066 [Diplonema papillatum]